METKIVYVIKQETPKGVWTSPETFEAQSVHKIKQDIRAGWLKGEARWAERPEGVFIWGLAANGTEL